MGDWDGEPMKKSEWVELGIVFAIFMAVSIYMFLAKSPPPPIVIP